MCSANSPCLILISLSKVCCRNSHLFNYECHTLSHTGHGCVWVCVYSRRASFHIELCWDDALLAENSSHLVHFAALHRLHQPIVILVPVCVLIMMTVKNQACSMFDSETQNKLLNTLLNTRLVQQ